MHLDNWGVNEARAIGFFLFPTNSRILNDTYQMITMLYTTFDSEVLELTGSIEVYMRPGNIWTNSYFNIAVYAV